MSREHGSKLMVLQGDVFGTGNNLDMLQLVGSWRN